MQAGYQIFKFNVAKIGVEIKSMCLCGVELPYIFGYCLEVSFEAFGVFAGAGSHLGLKVFILPTEINGLLFNQL